MRSPDEQLAALTRAFSSHLRTLEARGLRAVGAAPSPRFGVEITADIAAEIPAEIAADDQTGQSPLESAAEAKLAVEAAGEISAGEISADEISADEISAGEISAGEISDAEISRGEISEASGDCELDTLMDDGSRPPLERLGALRDHIGDCERCRLADKRRNIVFGVGNPDADLMFIGEAPGFDEDQQGIPFVGKAGQLLTRMIKAMGLSREEVYIANIVKCRPPQNRDPEADEIASCEPFLLKQIDIIAPRIIIALGSFAVKTLLRTTSGIMRLRGQWKSYHGIPLMPTFHPAYLLRNEAGKRPVWMDLQQVMAEMDRLGLQRRR